MKYLDVSFEDLNIQEELFLTIGNFDGIHRGHQQILNNLTTDSKISKTKSAILSFNPHPKIFFNNEKNFLINSKEKKISILKNLNIDYLIDLKFDNELTQLNFSEFEQNILLKKLSIKDFIWEKILDTEIKEKVILKHSNHYAIPMILNWKNFSY